MSKIEYIGNLILNLSPIDLESNDQTQPKRRNSTHQQETTEVRKLPATASKKNPPSTTKSAQQPSSFYSLNGKQDLRKLIADIKNGNSPDLQPIDTSMPMNIPKPTENKNKNRIQVNPEDITLLSGRQDLNALLNSLGDGKTSRYYKSQSFSGNPQPQKSKKTKENDIENANAIN